MKGQRVYPDGFGFLVKEGEYGKDDKGWCVHPPNSGAGYITGPLADEQWEVTEHEDGTITASPSIDTGSWHGHLIRGVWQA